MLRKNLLVVSALACVLVAGAVSVAVAGDHWMGSWKLDVAASKFSGPAPKSQMLKFEAEKDGIRLSSETVDADGKAMTGGYVSKFDGTDVPWTGNPNADMSSAKRIDANSYENTWKKNGKATIHSKVMVSEDGKTMKILHTGMDADGKAVENMAVYHRM